VGDPGFELSDPFRVRAEPPSGNADEGDVWSVCTVAYVCHRAGWLADSATVSRKRPNGLRNQDSGGSPLLVIAYAELPSGSESPGITPDVCGMRCQTRLPDADPAYNQALGELRAAVGTQLAHIAAAFGLDVEEPLSSIRRLTRTLIRHHHEHHGRSSPITAGAVTSNPRMSLVTDRVCATDLCTKLSMRVDASSGHRSAGG
jgi:hypothetical protein